MSVGEPGGAAIGVALPARITQINGPAQRNTENVLAVDASDEGFCYDRNDGGKTTKMTGVVDQSAEETFTIEKLQALGSSPRNTGLRSGEQEFLAACAYSA